MRAKAAPRRGDRHHMDEAERIRRYAPEGDGVGLAAYALHRRALLAFRSAFETRHERAPQEAEEAAFLLGEETPERIAAYRREAQALLGAPPPKPGKPAKPVRWPFFGQWVEAPASYDPDKPVNWRGFAARLVLLLGAVIGTAVLLRTLFVPH